jgi:hypothetical protein
MVTASFFWLASAVATNKIGVQPQDIHENPTKARSMYGGFKHQSLTSRAKAFARKFPYTHDEMIAAGTLTQDDSSNNQPELKRSFRQKLCCDFRIIERTRVEKCLFGTFRVGIAFFFIV